MRANGLSSRALRNAAGLGLALLFVLVAGCGDKPHASPPPARPLILSVTNNLSGSTNGADQYVSVFEPLPPAVGKDPFYPGSHRRDPVLASSSQEYSPHVDSLLILRSIIRGGKHSQAVINNQIMEPGEEEPVSIPHGHAMVKCLEIGADYVLVQVEGDAEPKRLSMDLKKN